MGRLVALKRRHTRATRTQGRTKRVCASLQSFVAGATLKATHPAPVMASSPKDSGDSQRPRQWSQHLAALIANLAPLGSGMAMGWSAPALPALRGETGEALALRLSLEQGSWVSSLVPLGALLGSLPAGPLSQRIGRKRAVLAHALPVLLGWLLILFAQQVWLLYLGRVLTGLGVGANIVLVSLYCEEIAEVRVRGVLGSYLDMSTSSGLLLMYVLGAFLPYSWFTAASVAPAAATLLLFWCMPESPAFLVGRHREADARRALQWLRGPAVDVQPELEALRLAAAPPAAATGARSAGWSLACCARPKLDRATSKALAIVFGLMFFSQATGGTAFVYYTEDVFRAVNSGLPGDICMVIVGAVSIVGTFLSIMLVDRVGRRFILILSSICLSVSLLGFSVYAHFDGKGVNLTSWNWAPLACLVVVMFNISFGYGPIKYFMMAELMPTEAKGWGSSVCVCFSRIFSFAIAKEFPIMIVSLGQDVTYAIFCVFSFLGTLFIVLFVPETKGKTREQIQEELTNKKTNQNRVNNQEKSEC